MPIPTAEDFKKLLQEAEETVVRSHESALERYSQLLLARFPVLIAGDKATAAIKAENQRLWVALQEQNPADAAFMALMREYLALKEELGDARAQAQRLAVRNQGLESCLRASSATMETLQNAREAIEGAIDELSVLEKRQG